jgi:hypothetical protein
MQSRASVFRSHVELGLLLGRPVVEQLAEAVLARTPQPLESGSAVRGQVEHVGARFDRHELAAG